MTRLTRRERRLVEVLAQELAAAQTETGEQIGFMAYVVDGRTQSSVSISGGWPPPAAREPSTPTFRDTLAALRATMARPGTGTWFSIKLTVPARGRPVATFDDDSEPLLLPPARPEDYARDLERFPRDVEHQPAWLRERLSWGVLTPQQTRLAELGRRVLEGTPMIGGTRRQFSVATQPEGVVVTDGWTGRRAVVALDETVQVVEATPRIREP